jgi:myo-inositol 2-dehydrogenase / D-chiro-inositol 1-dehydrogenase
MKMIHYGMVGCGMMGQEHLRNIALMPQTQVAVIYEPDAAMRAEAKKHAPNAVFVDSLDALLAHHPLDALVITSPNYLHAEQIRQITGKVQLPILLEKPAATSLEDVASLRLIAANYPAPIWTAMEYRYMPAIAALIAQAHAATDTGGTTMLSIREHRYPFLNKVGDWNRFNANTGGTLVEKCCHFFDLMRLIMGADPIRLYASGGMSHNHADESYDGKTPDILDNAFVVLDFASGQRAMLELCMFAEGSRYQEAVTVVGVNGKLECLVPGPGRFWPTLLGDAPVAQLIVSPRNALANGGPRTLDIPVDPALLAAGDHNGSTFYQHQKFAAVVRGEASVEVTLTDGLNAVMIGLAAEQSCKTGVAINLQTGAYALSLLGVR